MIHEVNESLFSLPLEDYILTFDDGLYSQYFFWPEIQKINTQKIFFISSGCVSEGQQSKKFLTCEDAHKKAFAGNFEDYMSVEQIKELDSDPQTSIGCHGHYHYSLSEMSGLKDKISYIQNDILLMKEWFNKNLGYTPTKFCYPHNDDLKGIYKNLLMKSGFNEFYGKERIDITLLKKQV